MIDENRQDRTSRERILNCAQRLFYEKGYDCVGVQEIVEAAGITKPTMYYYFKSKHGLLESLLEERANKLVEGMKQVTGRQGEYYDILFQSVKKYIQIALEHKEVYLIIVSLFSSARENEAYVVAKPYLVELQKVIHDFFQKYSKEQEHLKGKEDFYAISFTGTINYYLLVSFERGASEEVLLNENMIQNIVNLFL